MYFKFIFFGLFFAGSSLFAQQASYTDAAQNYNRLLIEKNNGSYTIVSNYKVIGSPYLYGEKRPGNLFAKGQTAYNIFLSYNTFNQEVGFYSAQNPSQQFVKSLGLVDSFEIKGDLSLDIRQDLRFVYAPLVGSKEKVYFQKLVNGPVYMLFKKYKSELGIVSTNYIQADLRQFNIIYEYYYKKAGSEELKKIKLNRNAIIKEFKNDKDLNDILSDDFTANPEEALKKAFYELNN